MGTAPESVYRLYGRDLYEKVEKVEDGGEAPCPPLGAKVQARLRVANKGPMGTDIDGGVLCDQCHERVDRSTLRGQFAAAEVILQEAAEAYHAACKVVDEAEGVSLKADEAMWKADEVADAVRAEAIKAGEAVSAAHLVVMEKSRAWMVVGRVWEKARKDAL